MSVCMGEVLWVSGIDCIGDCFIVFGVVDVGVGGVIDYYVIVLDDLFGCSGVGDILL